MGKTPKHKHEAKRHYGYPSKRAYRKAMNEARKRMDAETEAEVLTSLEAKKEALKEERAAARKCDVAPFGKVHHVTPPKKGRRREPVFTGRVYGSILANRASYDAEYGESTALDLIGADFIFAAPRSWAKPTVQLLPHLYEVVMTSRSHWEASNPSNTSKRFSTESLKCVYVSAEDGTPWEREDNPSEAHRVGELLRACAG